MGWLYRFGMVLFQRMCTSVLYSRNANSKHSELSDVNSHWREDCGINQKQNALRLGIYFGERVLSKWITIMSNRNLSTSIEHQESREGGSHKAERQHPVCSKVITRSFVQRPICIVGICLQIGYGWLKETSKD